VNSLPYFLANIFYHSEIVFIVPSTMASFRRAIVSALLRIEKADSAELFKYSDEENEKLKLRLR